MKWNFKIFLLVPYPKNVKVWTKLDNFLLNKIFIQVLKPFFCSTPYISKGSAHCIVQWVFSSVFKKLVMQFVSKSAATTMRPGLRYQLINHFRVGMNARRTPDVMSWGTRWKNKQQARIYRIKNKDITNWIIGWIFFSSNKSKISAKIFRLCLINEIPLKIANVRWIS